MALTMAACVLVFSLVVTVYIGDDLHPTSK